MSSIYELTGEWLRAYDLIDAEEFDEDVLIETLEQIEADIEYKADNYAKLCKNLAVEAAALKEEEARLYQRRKAKENAISRMKKSLQDAMEATGKVKIKTNLFSFSLQSNGGSVVFDKGLDEIPDMYKKISIEIDKQAIREALKEGRNFDFAHLEISESLRIR